MNIPVADPARELLKIKDFEKKLISVIKSGTYVGGLNVINFENNIKKFLNSKYVVSLNSGTDALLFSLLAIGIKKNDEVLVPSFTFFASVECILHLEAKPVFVDIDPDTFCLDVKDLENKITPRTRAILPVHLFGNNASIEEISALGKKHNIKIVEDVAQAFGSKTKAGKYLGTIGDVGAFSFFPSKTLGGIGDGGLIATNSKKYFSIISKLKNHGQSKNYNHDIVGYNSRLDSVNAFVLNEKLAIFKQIKEGRNNFFNFYNHNLSSLNWLKVPKKDSENTLLNYFTISVSTKIRPLLSEHLNNNGISNAIYYKKPIHTQKALTKYNTKKLKLFNTEKASRTVLSLPYFSFPEEKEFEYILSKFQNFKP
ncbi:MAG: transcriptional regulator [Cytophagia bacterium]|nr:transcriptional regulator [Cytophagia bacterium]